MQGDYITGKTSKPAITLEEFNEIDRLLKEEGPKVGRRLEKQFDQHAKDLKMEIKKLAEASQVSYCSKGPGIHLLKVLEKLIL